MQRLSIVMIVTILEKIVFDRTSSQMYQRACMTSSLGTWPRSPRSRQVPGSQHNLDKTSVFSVYCSVHNLESFEECKEGRCLVKAHNGPNNVKENSRPEY